jgi:archaellum component FlaG (FlaF/FlaG flagellin family)
MELSAYKELFLIMFIVLVLATNVWLFTSIKKIKSDGSFHILKKSDGSFHILKKSADTLRDPFKKENTDLEELSLLVKNIKNETINKENL